VSEKSGLFLRIHAFSEILAVTIGHHRQFFSMHLVENVGIDGLDAGDAGWLSNFKAGG
jgi:hypothetical protein